jgi:hypothetical protein
MIEIKNKKAVIKVLKAISWLDSKRWDKEENYNFINFFREDLTNSEKIFTHWISYITDRQMPFEIVWDKGGYVFSEIVYEYSNNNYSPESLLNNHYEIYKDKNDFKKYRFKSTDNQYFASRYVSHDYQNILQTLEILFDEKYGKNIIKFIIDIILNFKGESDLLIKVACALHLLTYQLEKKKAIPHKIIEILDSKKEFNKKIEEFKRTATIGKKRLWCCIRDYKKGIYNNIFNEAIKDNYRFDAQELITIWNNFPMSDIELPGDVWNNSPLFRAKLFANIINIDEVPDSWGMPKIIRKIYDQFKDSENIEFFYPEQFDITFDFVPRMCNKKLCDICIFGPNGAGSICIPSSDKYCPVSLVSCGYKTKCTGNTEDCLIKDDLCKGICKGR